MTKLKFLSILMLALIAAIICNCKNDYPTQSLPPFSAESIHSECKDGTQRLEKILGSGSIVLSTFNDTIRVLHANAHYNCCADIKTEVEKTNYGFDVREKDEGFDCRCTCDFDVTTFIYGLTKGTYLVKIYDINGNHLDQGYVIVRPKDPDGPSQ